MYLRPRNSKHFFGSGTNQSTGSEAYITFMNTQKNQFIILLSRQKHYYVQIYFIWVKKILIKKKRRNKALNYILQLQTIIFQLKFYYFELGYYLSYFIIVIFLIPNILIIVQVTLLTKVSGSLYYHQYIPILAIHSASLS